MVSGVNPSSNTITAMGAPLPRLRRRAQTGLNRVKNTFPITFMPHLQRQGTREGVPGLYRTGVKTYGLLIQPLNAFNLYPDIVILMVNPYQAMRIQQGYVSWGRQN